MERRVKNPHIVILYKEGEQVGHLSIPQTDPRFVKGHDLFEMAYDKIMAVQNDTQQSRRDTDPVKGQWDAFSVCWFGLTYVGDTIGRMLVEAA